LTDTGIKSAKPKSKPYGLPDSRGLRLEITPSGSKLWRWKYRFEDKEKLMALGQYPDVSLGHARERHLDGRKLLASGKDPMAERKAERSAEQVSSATSFSAISARWIEHWGDGKSPRHVDSVRRRMDADILPRLGQRNIAEIEAPELVAMVKAIEERGLETSRNAACR
jgi:hypothetical protein